MNYKMKLCLCVTVMALSGCGVAAKSGDTLTQQTEALVLDQISCRVPPQAGIAVRSMVKNRFLRETDENADGAFVFEVTQPINLLGFPIVRITGWQMSDVGDGSAVAPFVRGPGTPPPNYIEVVVKATEDELRQAALAAGLLEAEMVDDESMEPFMHEGQMRQPERSLPGFAVRDGDLDFIESPSTGAATISCSASERDFR